MHAAIPPAFLTCVAALAMAAFVVVRRRKEPIHWLLLALLLGLAMWTAGVLLRFTAATPPGLGTGLKLVFAGILTTSAFWLLLAAHLHARPLVAGRAPALVVFVPSGLLYLALLTNEGHRLLIRKLDFEAVAAGPPAYVGPLFWVFLAWVYGCVGYGVWLHLRAARRMIQSSGRRRGLLLAGSAAVPVVASTLYVFQLVPLRFDLTPSALLVSMVLLGRVLFRYQLFESLPLARSAVVRELEEGVVMATADGAVTDWNPAAERVLGDPPPAPGEPLTGLLARLAPDDDASGFVRSLASLFRTDAGSLDLHTRDGRVVELTAARVAEGRGEATGQFAILCDRTEQSRIETLARQTRRLQTVGALAAGVAHEVNDPLAFLRANLVEIERLGQIVDAQRDGPEAGLAAELLDLRTIALETLEGVERMRRIVEDLRGLSAGESRRAAAVDVGQVARDALFFADLESVPGLAVDVSLPALPPVRGHPERLFRAIANLLVNARQAVAGREHSRIRIAAVRRGDDVELSVEDDGPGIPETIRHRIFDPFFTTRGPDEGTGLGLTIAFDVAREHGGGLEERARADAGARFVLRLPVAAREGAASRGDADAGISPQSR